MSLTKRQQSIFQTRAFQSFYKHAKTSGLSNEEAFASAIEKSSDDRMCEVMADPDKVEMLEAYWGSQAALHHRMRRKRRKR